ncbi:hypothetical protein THAOC_32500 [Thalassiosira oceanica]|uniref:Uncharacterized protein n=1 Tax=Thalassiosira oceanica TaxID=159749 RepID=K0RPT7_THAOC|nr:hypothetical protein THAOC_32500 [Thalassiosira oceanica]|eukprot:EJK48682.1 hypothetical protein THAOC_32500 [Thalassiosira oceanica]
MPSAAPVEKGLKPRTHEAAQNKNKGGRRIDLCHIGTEKEETASDHGAAGPRRQQQRLGLGRRGPRGGGTRPEVARPGEEEARPTKKKKDGKSDKDGPPKKMSP